MSQPENPLHQQAKQALREQRLNEAIDLLARAVMADDRDAEAKALLGVAYGQKGLYDQARRALQTACELQPLNPHYFFNLGVVEERAGNRPAALDAYRQAIRVQPNHVQTRQRLQSLGPEGQAVIHQASAPPPPAPSEYTGSPGASPGYQQPPAGGPPGAPLGGPPAPGAPQPPGTYPGAPGQPGAYPGAPAPYGAGYPADTGPYGAAPGAGADSDPGPPDAFDILQAFKDWVAVISRPGQFFEAQAAAAGWLSPLAFIAINSLLMAVILQVIGLVQRIPSVASPGFLPGSVFGALIQNLAAAFLLGGMIHLGARLFKGDGSYNGSVRAVAYGFAPQPIMALIGGIIAIVSPPSLPAQTITARNGTAEVRMVSRALQPGVLQQEAPRQPSAGSGSRISEEEKARIQSEVRAKLGPLAEVMETQARLGQNSPANLLGGIWILVLLVIGVGRIHHISGGPAFFAVILPGSLCCCLLLLAILGPVVAIMSAARGGQ